MAVYGNRDGSVPSGIRRSCFGDCATNRFGKTDVIAGGDLLDLRARRGWYQQLQADVVLGRATGTGPGPALPAPPLARWIRSAGKGFREDFSPGGRWHGVAARPEDSLWRRTSSRRPPVPRYTEWFIFHKVVAVFSNIPRRSRE